MVESFERKLDARLVASIVAAGSLSFCAVVFETAMNVALPALMEEFAVDTATIQWITSGYLLMLAVMIPTFPFLKARFALRRLFVCAVLLFLAGTLLCAAAPAFPVLLMGRVVQGVSTGIAIPLMFSIVVDQVPHEKMGLMMGVASLITAVAPAVGPSYGGAVMELAGWRMVFLCLVPVTVLSLGIGSACVRQATRVDAGARFDLVGFVLLAQASLLSSTESTLLHMRVQAPWCWRCSLHSLSRSVPSLPMRGHASIRLSICAYFRSRPFLLLLQLSQRFRLPSWALPI